MKKFLFSIILAFALSSAQQNQKIVIDSNDLSMIGQCVMAYEEQLKAAIIVLSGVTVFVCGSKDYNNMDAACRNSSNAYQEFSKSKKEIDSVCDSTFSAILEKMQNSGQIK